MVLYHEVQVASHTRTQWIDISEKVHRVIQTSGITSGICLVSSLHTTAGITLNENADPDVQRDFFHKINQIIPRDPSFHHAEGNSDSHLKASLVGLSVQLPVKAGNVVLGTWQSIYFCEFDGPRSRRVSVTVMGE
jgi:secondary thiamine-phosphate synthase enzyme